MDGWTKKEIENLLSSPPVFRQVWTAEAKELARQIFNPAYASAFVAQIQEFNQSNRRDPSAYEMSLMAYKARKIASAAICFYDKTADWPDSFVGMSLEEMREITGGSDDPDPQEHLTDDQKASDDE